MDQCKRIPQLLGQDFSDRCTPDNRKTVYVTPKRVVLSSQAENPQALLETRADQISLAASNPCILSGGDRPAFLVLDYGVELQGGAALLIWASKGKERQRIRLRFGESVAEVMSDIGGPGGATNDHATRDMVLEVGMMSLSQIGNTGFRFLRVDLLEGAGCQLVLKSIKATFTYRDIPYRGSFHCSDALLDRIWNTAAYTLHLNMQNYIWDGIKRDRLVWIGDMHPEVMGVRTLFGADELVPKSLDFIRDETPLPGFMNGFSSYSMWWVVIQRDWYQHTGDYAYLDSQRTYLKGLYQLLAPCIGPDGQDTTPPVRFVDWPSSDSKEATDAGVQALRIWATRSFREMFEILGEKELAQQCEKDLALLSSFHPDPRQYKQAAALMVLNGLAEPEAINASLLSKGGAAGMSTFMSYYILKARALAGDIKGSLDAAREYYGAMLSLGATTFWEDFDMEWMKQAAPIDGPVPEGKVDVHGAYGKYCYKGYRHSLCHGWSCGVVPFLAEWVLGIRVTEPGCRTVHIAPQLGDLSFAEGTFPTPMVRHSLHQPL